MVEDTMRQRGGIILALLFILILVGLGIIFIQQVYLEESNMVTRDAGIREVPEEQQDVLAQ
jgi:hypothetical protein